MNKSNDTNKGPPRKLTAVATVGERGQLFTVYEKNWNCPSCQHENYPTRIRCFRCKKSKPSNIESQYVSDPALIALQVGIKNAWREAVDPASRQIYYYNVDTNETQWERPAEMGEAPIGTGLL